MGHFLFQSIFYLSVIFKMLPLSIFNQFLQLQEVQALWSSMTTVAVKVKSSFRFWEEVIAKSMNVLNSFSEST